MRPARAHRRRVRRPRAGRRALLYVERGGRRSSGCRRGAPTESRRFRAARARGTRGRGASGARARNSRWSASTGSPRLESSARPARRARIPRRAAASHVDGLSTGYGPPMSRSVRPLSRRAQGRRGPRARQHPRRLRRRARRGVDMIEFDVLSERPDGERAAADRPRLRRPRLARDIQLEQALEHLCEPSFAGVRARRRPQAPRLRDAGP